MGLDDRSREIYARQLIMDEIGEAGQQKLAAASVLVVGCGGLGAPVLYYLAAMGIGHLGLCDGDVVSLSNLNRQVLYSAADVGQPKALTAAARLCALNPTLHTTVYQRFLDAKLAAAIISDYDIAVDCLDNFSARFLLNDACVAAGKPFVHAGVGEFFGQLLTVTPGRGPCLRCLFPEGEQKRRQEKPLGIVGPTAGVVGALQALEVLKYLLGLPINNDGFLLYDGLNLRLEKVALAASAGCQCQKK